MKQILALALIALTLVGCATTPQTPEDRARQLGEIAHFAAHVGTVERLKAHPEDRPAFVVAEALLAQVAGDTNATPAQLYDALRGLPVEELEGPYGALVIGAVVSVTQGFSSEPLRQNVYFNQIVKRIHSGMQSGLKQSAPANTAATGK